MSVPSGEAAVRHHIRAWREHRGMNQQMLADRAGISRSYLSKVETGARRYDQCMLESIAKVLDCDPADLVRWTPELQGLFASLTPDERSTAIAILRAIRDAR